MLRWKAGHGEDGESLRYGYDCLQDLRMMYVRAKEFSLDKTEIWRSWKKTKYYGEVEWRRGLDN